MYTIIELFHCIPENNLFVNVNYICVCLSHIESKVEVRVFPSSTTDLSAKGDGVGGQRFIILN